MCWYGVILERLQLCRRWVGLIHFLQSKIPRLMATGQGLATGSDIGQSAKFICVPSFTPDWWIVGVMQKIWCLQPRRGVGWVDSVSVSEQCFKWRKKKFSPLTNNDSSNGKEHKGISYEESFHIILRDVLQSLHGQQRPGLDPGSNLVEPSPGPLWVISVALSHSCRWNLQIC